MYRSLLYQTKGVMAVYYIIYRDSYWLLEFGIWKMALQAQIKPIANSQIPIANLEYNKRIRGIKE